MPHSSLTPTKSPSWLLRCPTDEKATEHGTVIILAVVSFQPLDHCESTVIMVRQENIGLESLSGASQVDDRKRRSESAPRNACESSVKDARGSRCRQPFHWRGGGTQVPRRLLCAYQLTSAAQPVAVPPVSIASAASLEASLGPSSSSTSNTS